MSDQGSSGIGIAVRYDGETTITWLSSPIVCELLARALNRGVVVEQVAIELLGEAVGDAAGHEGAVR